MPLLLRSAIEVKIEFGALNFETPPPEKRINPLVLCELKGVVSPTTVPKSLTPRGRVIPGLEGSLGSEGATRKKLNLQVAWLCALARDPKATSITRHTATVIDRSDCDMRMLPTT